MRLIDADEYLTQIEDQYMEHDITRSTYIDLEDRIMQQPTVDAVPVQWIKEYIRTHPASTDIYFKWMIDEWKEEQENRMTNWDTETAKTCKLPKYIPGICLQCRDYKYCYRQMTMDDLISSDKDK